MNMFDEVGSLSPKVFIFDRLGGFVAERSDGPWCPPAPRPTKPSRVSKETFPTSATKSVDIARWVKDERPLSTDIDLLLFSCPSIFDMPNAHLSNIGLLPKDEDGDGRGWDPVIKMDSDLGVWFPPRPFDGGTPTRRVGGVLAVAQEVASSDWMIPSTSSIQIRTFSGLRSYTSVIHRK